MKVGRLFALMAFAAMLPGCGTVLTGVAAYFLLKPPEPVRAPILTSASPVSGTIHGGTAVTISGYWFQNSCTVLFGAMEATVTFVDSKTLACTTPAHSPAETVDVKVVNPDGQNAVLTDAFTYVVPPPDITGISPSNCPLAGGTTVTINGVDFQSGLSVTFDGTNATGISVSGTTSITCTTPPHSAGVVTVRVTNPDNQSDTTAFSYLAPPVLTGISPATGYVSGGARVTVTGANFIAGATVSVGGAACSNYDYNTIPSQIICDTPPGSLGAADVVLTNPDSQNDTLSAAFTYTPVPPPSLTSISPDSGYLIGGTSVAITGTAFQSGATVLIGGTSCTNYGYAGIPTQITCTTPTGTLGAKDVTVTNPDTQADTLAGGFTYIPLPAPQVLSVTPTNGTVSGGTHITITGNYFQSGATVTVGSSACTAYVYTNVPTQVECNVPAGSAGPADVTLTNPDTQFSTLTAGFTYLVGPTVSSISPTFCMTNGGIPATITGSGFVSGAQITVGGRPASSITFISSSQLTCLLPWGTSGSADITVVNPDNGTGTLTSGLQYNPNYVLRFDGIDDLLDCGTSNTMDGFTACTIEAWFKINQITNYGGIVRRNSPTASCWTCQEYSSQAQFGIFTPTFQNFYSNSTLSTNLWYHIACVYSGSQMRIYLNGVLDRSQSASGTIRTLSTAHTYVGSENGISSTFFNGWIDEVRVSNVARYSSNFAIPMHLSTDANTVLLIHMDEGSGTVANDASGMGNHGIFASNPVWTQADLQLTPVVTSLNTTTGPTAGGTSVTITGSKFCKGAVVRFGSTYAGSIVIVDATTITCTTPPGSAGSVNVEVINPGNSSGSLVNGFTYQ